MRDLNFNKKYIPFSNLDFNLIDIPKDMPMLVLDLSTKQLCLFFNGIFYKLNQSKIDKYINNDKIDISILPPDLADKFWVINQIDKKMQNAFILKGKKASYNQILNIANPKVGDVWFCKKKLVIYTQQKKWEQLNFSTDINYTQLDKISQLINNIEKSILQNKLAIEAQAIRAKNQQNLIKEKLSSSVNDLKENINDQINRAKNIEQILKQKIQQNKKKIQTQTTQFLTLKSLLSSYNFDENEAKLTKIQNTVSSQSQALKELYTNMNIVQNNVDRKLEKLQQYVNSSTDQFSNLLNKAIQNNSFITQTKLDNLSSTLILNVQQIIEKSQQNITDIISAAGYIELSGIPEKIDKFKENLQQLSTRIQYNNEYIKAEVSSGITTYDNNFNSLSISVDNFINQIKLL